MPVKRRSGTELAKPDRKTRAPEPKETFVLPTKKSEPKKSMQDYSTLLYGEKKIGKTSLASKFPDAIHLMFEQGGKALRIYQKPVTSWGMFIAAIDALEKDDRFKTVVVDTVDIAYDYCFDYSCKKMAITHPHDENDFGKSWKEIRKEFTSQIQRLLALDKGVVFISHATETEIKSRSGSKFHKVVPTLSGQGLDTMVGIVDVIAYYGYEGTDRTIYLDGDEYVTAGCRLEENFLTIKGERVVSFSTGKSSTEAFKNLTKAFNNQLKDSGDYAGKQSLERSK